MIAAPEREKEPREQNRNAGCGSPPSPPALRFACPFCRIVLEVPAELVGVRGPCPRCREEIEAPPALQAFPEPIAVKPRRADAERPKNAHRTVRPHGVAAPLPMPSLGVPPPPPPPPEPDPPVPRQPPIPPQPTVNVERFTLEERLEWGVAPAARRRSKNRPGRSIHPTSTFSMRYRNRRELMLTLKALLAFLATIAIAIAIAILTKRTVLAPSGAVPAPGIHQPVGAS